MFNNNSSNTIITFYGGTRGNFVRCCLTLAPNTADASFNDSDIDYRLNIYKENSMKTPSIITVEPWGPAHMDTCYNYDDERIESASHSDNYIHCGHLHQIPSKDGVEATELNNKFFVNITMTDSEIHNIKLNPVVYTGTDEINRYSDSTYLSKFFNGHEWHDIPHSDILNKSKFLEHCHTINNDCYIDKISEYYDVYSKWCISKNYRF